MSKTHEWGELHGHGEVICVCDNCQEEFAHEFSDGHPDYRGCQSAMESHGWFSRTIRGSWYDFCCEECYLQYIKKHA